MLFSEQVARKPNLYPWTQDFIDSIWKGFWTPNKFTFEADYAQFLSDCTDEEREVITRTLSAIGQIEIAVKTFWAKLGDNFKHPSMSDLGIVMAQSEVIHNIAYEKLLDKLRMTEVFERNLKEPVVKGRVDYLRKYLKRVYGDDKRKQYVYAIILFTLFVENCSLFSQFYVVLWFNRYKALFKDTAQQVQYTRNEEMLHAQVGIKLINTLRQEYPELFDEELEQRIREETESALEAETKVIDWMLNGHSEGNLNRDVLIAFVQDRLNQSLEAIGYRPAFAIDQDILAQSSWMDEESLGNNMTDFFWKEPVEYAKNVHSYDEDALFD